MAWMATKWACGHGGQTRQIGPSAKRAARIAFEAGRKCMACWLLEQWEVKNDPRRGNVQMARDIAEGRGIRIIPFCLGPRIDAEIESLAEAGY